MSQQISKHTSNEKLVGYRILHEVKRTKKVWKKNIPTIRFLARQNIPTEAKKKWWKNVSEELNKTHKENSRIFWNRIKLLRGVNRKQIRRIISMQDLLEVEMKEDLRKYEFMRKIAGKSELGKMG